MHNNLKTYLFAQATGSFDNISDGSKSITKYNPSSNHDIMQLNSIDEYSSHLENVQNDLDSLKDLLRGDNYCFDPSTLVDVSTLEKLFSNVYLYFLHSMWIIFPYSSYHEFSLNIHKTCIERSVDACTQQPTI